MIWERSGEAYYATVTGPDDEVLIRLIVEPHGDLWDWTVWRIEDDHYKARKGIASTARDAMRDAEASTIDGTI